MPPVLYEMPSFTGVSAKVVRGVPVARSQVTARSQAAPHTLPCSIAMTGAGHGARAAAPARSPSSRSRASCPSSGISWTS